MPAGVCAEGKWSQVGLAIFLLVATNFTYVPQLVKIAAKKSHRGLSLANFLPAALVNCLQLVNYLAVEWHKSFECCGKSATTRVCVGGLLPFLQVALIYVYQQLIVVFYMWYFCHDFAKDEADRTGVSAGTQWGRVKLGGWIVATIELAIFAAYLGLGLVTGPSSTTLHTYGVVLNICASVLISIHWLPQIAETCRLRGLGSLSLVFLLLQAIGGVLTAVNLAPGGLLKHWYVTFPFLVASAMMFFVSGQGAYFRWCSDQPEKQPNASLERFVDDRRHSAWEVVQDEYEPGSPRGSKVDFNYITNS